MAKPEYVQVQIFVRHRDSDWNIIGEGSNTSYDIRIDEFNRLAEQLWQEKPLPPNDRYTAKKKREALLQKLTATITKLLGG